MLRKNRKMSLKTPLKKKILFTFSFIGVCLLFLLAVDLYLATRPPVLLEKASAFLQGIFRYPVSIEGVVFSPLRGLTLTRLQVLDSASSPFLEVERITVIPSFSDLLRGRMRANGIFFQNPTLSLREDQGRWNFEEIFKPGKGRSYLLPRIVVAGGSLKLSSRSYLRGGLVQEIHGIDFTLNPSAEGRFRGRIADIQWGKTDVEGSLPLTGKDLWIAVKKQDLQLSPKVRSFLSEEWKNLWDRFSPEGALSLGLKLAKRRDGNPQVFGEAHLRSLRLSPPSLPFPADNVQGTIRFTSKDLTFNRVSGSYGDCRVTLDGPLFLETPLQSDLKFSVENLPLDERVRKVLPPEGQRIWDAYLPKGIVHLKGRISGKEKLELHIDEGRLLQGEITFRGYPNPETGVRHGFPYTVHEIEGGFRFSPGRIELFNLHGWEFPRSRPEGRGAEIEFCGIFEGEGFSFGNELRIFAKNVPLDAKLRSSMGSIAEIALDPYQPSGFVNLSSEVLREKGPEKPTLVNVYVDVQDARAEFKKFPYPLERITGRIDVTPGKVALKDVQGFKGNALVKVNGVFPSTKGKMEHHLVVEGKDVPFDDALFRALAEENREIEEIWNAFQPEGTFDFLHTRIQKEGEEEVHNHTSVEGKGIRFTYHLFPYPLSEVRGIFELADGEIYIHKLRGLAGGGEFTARGKISSFKEGDVDLQIQAEGIPVDEALKEAIQVIYPPFERIWDWLLPSGKLDGICFIKRSGKGALEYSLETECRDVSLNPSSFPCPVENLCGKLILGAMGLSFQNLKGKMGAGILLLDKGSILFKDEASQGDFLLKGSELPLELLLPQLFHGGEQAWETVTGKLGNVYLNLAFSHRSEGESWIRFKGNCDIQESGLGEVLPLKRIWGKMDNFEGVIRNDELERVAGSFSHVDLLLLDLKFEQMKGTFTFQTPQLSISDIEGFFYGGILDRGSNSFSIRTRCPCEYKGNLSFRDADLTRISKEEFPSGDPLKGSLSGSFAFENPTGALANLKGKGELTATDADLISLPFFLAIFDLFGLAGIPFQRGEAAFKLKDKAMEFPHLYFRSLPLSLTGKGIMDLGGAVDFTFVPTLAGGIRPRIPLLEDPWSWLKKNFGMTVKVRGTFAEPEVSFSNTFTDLFIPPKIPGKRVIYKGFRAGKGYYEF